MYIVLGGTGRAGSATARALIADGMPVTIVTRDAGRGTELAAAGAHIAVADIHDVPVLRKVFQSGRRAFLLNPPADPSGDTDTLERAGAAAILAALEGSGLEKVVAVSTYGARAGERCGDLTVLHEFEMGLRAQSIPAAINRGAYYMSNWTGMLNIARRTGTLPCFFPADFSLAMVAPQDLATAAIRRLLSGRDDHGLHWVEGPERYTPADVAACLAELLGRPVEPAPIARENLVPTFLQFGFCRRAAESYARMTAAVLDGEIETPANPERGPTSLRDFLEECVQSTGP